jgi:hypothetical protein
VALRTAPVATALLIVTFMGTLIRAVTQNEQATPSHQKLSFEGDTALWTMAIKPDKTADFEQIMKRLFEALQKSPDPQRQRQAAGWKVLRVDKALPDGNIAYVHIVRPVVAGADYTIMQTLYEAYPDERQKLYELYRGAFAQNLSLATGSVAVSGSPTGQ